MENSSQNSTPYGARGAVPILAIAIGGALLAFAAAWNRIEVIVPAEKPQAQPEAAESAPPPPPPGIILPDEGGYAFPDELEPPPEPATAEGKTTEPTLIVSSENDIIRETTRGGVTLNADGRIERTWAVQPPQVCPT